MNQKAIIQITNIHCKDIQIFENSCVSVLNYFQITNATILVKEESNKANAFIVLTNTSSYMVSIFQQFLYKELNNQMV